LSFWDSIASIFRAAPAPRPVTMVERLQPYGSLPARGTRERFLAYRRQPWFRAVAHKVAIGVASTPWKLYVKARLGSERRELPTHPILDLLRFANPVMPGREALEQTQLSLDIGGDCFWVLERNVFGAPLEAYPMPAHWCIQTPTSAAPFYKFSNLRGYVADVAVDDVIWFKEPDPENPYGRGVGVAEALSDELDTDEFASKRTKAFFNNGALPDTIVVLSGAAKEEVERVEASWRGKFQGFWNSGRTQFTNAPNIDVKRLDTTFKDMDLVDLRKQQRDTVIQVFGVPPEVLGVIENSNRATIDSAFFLYASTVLVPRLDRLKAELNAKLVPMFGDGLELDYESPVPADREFALKVMQLRNTAFTDNEIRDLAKLPAVAGKDVFPTAPAFPAFPQMSDDPEFVKALHPRRKQITEGDVPNVLAALRPERITDYLEPEMRQRLEEWGKAVLQELGEAADQDLVARLDLLNPKIAPFLQEFSATRIRGLVDTTTREQLRSQLAEGIKAGESIDDIELRVECVFDVATDARAENIARTETLRASNWATHEAQKASGVVDTRKWVATPDGRTRQTHRELNGQETALDDPFYVDGKTAMFPGAFGDPAEDCQCRCTTVAVISDDLDGEPPEDDGKRYLPHAKAVLPGATDADLLACWKAYDEALAPWDEAAVAALRKGFRAQKADVLKALRDLRG
jgi:HK97 family phage portal protein